MKRKTMVITIMALALACFVGCSNNRAVSNDKNTDKKDKSVAATTVETPTLPEYPYSVIISDDRLIKDPDLPDAGNYVKQLKILYGEIPAEAPFLTREKAIEICQGLTNLPDNSDEFEWEVTKAFNAYALAPDFEGGSGIMHRIYYTDESRNTYIDVMYGAVYYRNRITKDMELIIDTTGYSK